MKFTGKVTAAIDKSGISKQEKPFIAWQYRLEETEGQYPQSCLIDVFGDRTDKLNVGDIAEVDFNMKCDEYQGKLYGKNNAWRITVITAAAGVSAPQPVTQSNTQPLVDAPQSVDNNGVDDLPFRCS